MVFEILIKHRSRRYAGVPSRPGGWYARYAVAITPCRRCTCVDSCFPHNKRERDTFERDKADGGRSLDAVDNLASASILCAPPVVF